mmetsp:Transcript_16268/g.18854  ORF Transcript_16268/g.18854 Transcript_16268/m.18854 type:complete len:367 (-) Transcript_16268:603-1703(-)
MRSTTSIGYLWTVLLFTSVPTRIGSGIFQCTGFSLSSDLIRPGPSISPFKIIKELKKSQTKEDLLVSKWFTEEAGILGTSRTCLSTTAKSVGGRGLFWVGIEPAFQGDVLAFIPSKCVITASNLQTEFPGLEGMQESDSAWQAKMTALASHCLDSSGKDYMNRVQWIESWRGGGPSCPQPSEFYSTEELNQLAEMAKSTVDLVREKIDERYNTYKRDFKDMKKQKYYDGDAVTFGDMYSIVVSRTACLGPTWGNKRGIIPMHDFINHHPPSGKSNVELFCFGDLREIIGFAHANELIKRVLNNPNEIKGVSKDADFDPKDNDVLLIASRDIDIGEELWLSYREGQKLKTDEEKIWLMLQYGFPLHH